MIDLANKKRIMSDWFAQIRYTIASQCENIEKEFTKNFNGVYGDGTYADDSKNNAVFSHNSWHREHDEDSEKQLLGSGKTGIMKGHVFEKIGINFSHVHGKFSEKFAHEIPGTDKSNGNFWASGVSFVAHPRNPYVPAAHMNTRMIVTSKSWFGGGGDLNPAIETPKDTQDFHQAFKTLCDDYNDTAYDKYKKWCDDYFYIPHRKKNRGVGGIFYDYLDSGDWHNDMNFTKQTAKVFGDIYTDIVKRHMYKTWNDDDKKQQLLYRGLYAEYNLIYDRGTRFGLMSGGNSDAILMSLPPIAHWD